MASLAAAAPADLIELCPEHDGRAAILFLALGTQWRTGGLGQLIGLDYALIEPTAKLTGIAIEPRQPLFVMLREMEATALTVLRERAKAEARR